MSHKIRLGPIAIFLTVIAAMLATLAMLTVSTAHSSLVLSQRRRLSIESGRPRMQLFAGAAFAPPRFAFR